MGQPLPFQASEQPQGDGGHPSGRAETVLRWDSISERLLAPELNETAHGVDAAKITVEVMRAWLGAVNEVDREQGVRTSVMSFAVAEKIATQLGHPTATIEAAMRRIKLAVKHSRLAAAPRCYVLNVVSAVGSCVM